MRLFKKILAPVDLSEHSRRGLAYALSIARENQAELHVLHVADEFQAWAMADDGAFFSSGAALWEADRIVREARLDLHRFLAIHGEELRLLPAVRSKVVLGSPAERILEFASEEKTDLIVMAPRPLGTFKRWLLGSVTDRVSRESPCPVLSLAQPQSAHRLHSKLAPLLWPPLLQRHASF